MVIKRHFRVRKVPPPQISFLGVSESVMIEKENIISQEDLVAEQIKSLTTPKNETTNQSKLDRVLSNE